MYSQAIRSDPLPARLRLHFLLDYSLYFAVPVSFNDLHDQVSRILAFRFHHYQNQLFVVRRGLWAWLLASASEKRLIHLDISSQLEVLVSFPHPYSNLPDNTPHSRIVHTQPLRETQNTNTVLVVCHLVDDQKPDG